MIEMFRNFRILCVVITLKPKKCTKNHHGLVYWIDLIETHPKECQNWRKWSRWNRKIWYWKCFIQDSQVKQIWTEHTGERSLCINMRTIPLAEPPTQLFLEHKLMAMNSPGIILFIWHTCTNTRINDSYFWCFFWLFSPQEARRG